MKGGSLPAFVILMCCTIPVGLVASSANSSFAGYPWIHFFERPEMPEVHCAFADAEGKIVISTGDWNDGWYDTDRDYVQGYWSNGMFWIREDEFERIECPSSTYVIDCANDSTGITWVLLAQVSFSGLTNRRLGRIQNGGITVDNELTVSIPKEPSRMIADAQGRIFVVSWRDTHTSTREYFVSWWTAEGDASLCVCEVPGYFGHIIYSSMYDPWLGPDGRVYFFAGDSSDYYAYPPRRIVWLDPDSERWGVYSMDCVIRGFYVDPVNVKWFGTEDGLVRFDGENWSRHTTENSGLPHNLVRQMVYDEADETYYVVTSDRPEDYYDKPDWTAAFSTFSSRGQMIGRPLYFDNTPSIYEGAAGIWYLRVHTDGDVVMYSYDHLITLRWRLSDWVDTTSPYVEYIGPTSDGRTFLVTRTCVMIW